MPRYKLLFHKSVLLKIIFLLFSALIACQQSIEEEPETLEAYTAALAEKKEELKMLENEI